MAPKSKTKDVSIAARITAEQAQRLDEVRRAEPVLPSVSAAIGRVIDMITEDDLDGFDAAEGKENVIDAGSVAMVLEAMATRTRAYNDVASILQPTLSLLERWTSPRAPSAWRAPMA